MTSRDQLLNAQIATELQRSHLEMDPQDPHSRSGPNASDGSISAWTERRHVSSVRTTSQLALK